MSAFPLQAGRTPDFGLADKGRSKGLGASVLILDNEPGMRRFLHHGLVQHFALVEVAADAAEAQALMSRCHFDLLVADIRLPGKTGIEWVSELREQGSSLDVVFITAQADLETAIAALRAGASDFLLKPFRVEQLLAAVARSTERRKLSRELFLLRGEAGQRFTLEGVVGVCEPMKEICAVINRVAPMPSTVLVQGETGTGKELIARAIHARSGRPAGFVAVNCSAVSPELLESELFGHVKGAFTGAHQAREGLFSFARGGSLFLDEISEMPVPMQAKLLRVLEDKTIRPVGGNQEVPVDVRIIAATNRDLGAEVEAGHFRRDLFYRLDVVSVRVPPLRERSEDIKDLMAYFIDRLSRELGLAVPECDWWDIEQLRRYDWPGNVRELRNVIERCLLLGKRPGQCIPSEGKADLRGGDSAGELDLSLATVEKRHILGLLNAAGGNKSAAARKLGISRKTLERKLKLWHSETDQSPG